MSFISAFGIANPEHRIPQSVIAEFMMKMMAETVAEGRKIRAIFNHTGIEQRYSVLDDYGKTNGFSFFPHDRTIPFPGTASRMDLFKAHAPKISSQAVLNLASEYRFFRPEEVTHLIVVSCTGMYAPGLDIDLIRSIGLKNTIERTCIYFMGCYAAFNAIKAGHAICESNVNAKVLIVCTELCSIHFQNTPTNDNILANALFSDGAAAILMEARALRGAQLEIQKFYNTLSSAGEEDMAWAIGNEGFVMKLSAYVPDLIKNEIGSLVTALLSGLDVELKDIKFFSFHPGGKKILDAIRTALNLQSDDMTHSNEVLRNFGNMSSASVLFVLKSIFDSLNISNSGDLIMGAAFGPGLTLESMLLRVVTNPEV